MCSGSSTAEIHYHVGIDGIEPLADHLSRSCCSLICVLDFLGSIQDRVKDILRLPAAA